MPIHVRQHLPGFVDIDPQPEVDVAGIDEVLAIPWIASWTTAPTFHRWSVSSDERRHMLMAEMKHGTSWHVVAYLTSDTPIALPEWRPVDVTA